MAIVEVEFPPKGWVLLPPQPHLHNMTQHIWLLSTAFDDARLVGIEIVAFAQAPSRRTEMILASYWCTATFGAVDYRAT